MAQQNYEEILADLVKERKKLSTHVETDKVLNHESDPDAWRHYTYILPLVREIHLLEMKVKDKERDLKRMQQKRESERLADSLLAVSLDEKDCVLKRWFQELQKISTEQGSSSGTKSSDKKSSVNNVVYKVHHDGTNLVEKLAFTVLSEAVFIRTKIVAKSECSCIHLACRRSSRVGVSSDTFVPDLATTVRTALTQEQSISCIISLISSFILKDVAPFVIVIPMKKSKKKKKEKHKE